VPRGRSEDRVFLDILPALKGEDSPKGIFRGGGDISIRIH